MQRRLFQALLLTTVVLIAGCATAPPASNVVLNTPYASSRDGALRYRLPAGWFDATADTQGAGHVIWLLRNDYAATIAVNEIHLDGAAREALRSGGVIRLANLSMALAAGGSSYTVVQQPEEMQVNGRPLSVCALTTTPANDILRVVLVDTGGKVYSITALVPGETKRGDQSEIFSVQDALVGSLRW